MSKWSIGIGLIALAGLSGCGSQAESPVSARGVPGPSATSDDQVMKLDGLPVERVWIEAALIWAAGARSGRPPAESAAAMDRKFSIRCEEVCHVSIR